MKINFAEQLQSQGNTEGKAYLQILVGVSW